MDPSPKLRDRNGTNAVSQGHFLARPQRRCETAELIFWYKFLSCCPMSELIRLLDEFHLCSKKNSVFLVKEHLIQN
jgi:hypothetical protein